MAAATLALRRDAEPLAALGSAPLQDEPAVLRAHAHEEAVGARAAAVVGLISTLHGCWTRERFPGTPGARKYLRPHLDRELLMVVQPRRSVNARRAPACLEGPPPAPRGPPRHGPRPAVHEHFRTPGSPALRGRNRLLHSPSDPRPPRPRQATFPQLWKKLWKSWRFACQLACSRSENRASSRKRRQQRPEYRPFSLFSPRHPFVPTSAVRGESRCRSGAVWFYR
jgi:hypothetical protein